MNRLWLMEGDCLERMMRIEPQSVDLILCDLPYGTTACSWDVIIPPEHLWWHYRRIIKPKGAIVLTASQPFTTTLIASNMEWFKYEWIWEKNRPTNFAHAKNKPMKKHENVLVFSPGTTVHATQSSSRMNYYPQGLTETSRVQNKRSGLDTFFGARKSHADSYVQTVTGYPHSILRFSTEQKKIHPTAKPVDLMAYLIRTYTKPNDIVLDNCMGSGSTGVAAMQTGRRFIGIEKERPFYETALARILEAKAIAVKSGARSTNSKR